jgi:protease-4
MSQEDPTQHPHWERKILEDLAFATMKEQRATRRWKIFFRLSWLGLVVALIVWWNWSGQQASNISFAHTAVIEIRGAISADSEASASSLSEALREAFEEPSAKGLILLINSPGGSPVQAGIIADEIHRLKTLHNKPVHAVVEETCASAAYYIASAADNIYVDKASLVGSIGVLMNGFGFTGLLDKLGVERRLMIAGDNKGFMDPFSPLSESQRQHTQQMLDDIHQQFVSVVQRGRGERLNPEADEEIFSGLVWTGERAVEMGLADDLGSLDQVARDVIGAARLVDYTQRENLAERLARRFGAGAADSALRILQMGNSPLR